MKKKILLESFAGIPENYFEVNANIYSRAITIYDPINFIPRKSITLNLSFNSDAIKDSVTLKGIIAKDENGNYKTDKYGDICIVNLNEKEIIEILSDELANKIIKSAPDFIIEAKEQIMNVFNKTEEYSIELTENFFNTVKEELLENVFERLETGELNLHEFQTRKLRQTIMYDDNLLDFLSDDEKKNISKNICEELFFLYRNEIKNGYKILIHEITLTPSLYDTKNIFIQKRGILIRHKIIK